MSGKLVLNVKDVIIKPKSDGSGDYGIVVTDYGGSFMVFKPDLVRFLENVKPGSRIAVKTKPPEKEGYKPQIVEIDILKEKEREEKKEEEKADLVGILAASASARVANVALEVFREISKQVEGKEGIELEEAFRRRLSLWEETCKSVLRALLSENSTEEEIIDEYEEEV
ncbi:hypothetical protein DRN43_00665 [Thermococci archaeon]|nr:MAG: hypothetical protein DRN43_00665 [Thermococci archaeon]RLG47798.1 MAG: hypothetical protein DRN90_04395 [Candidatus Korarchaeota archaeon]